MSMSGYGQDRRIEVLRSGVKRYREMEGKEDRGEKRICRKSEGIREERRIKKWLARTDWYKGKKNENVEKKEEKREGNNKIEKKEDEKKLKVETILFVPYTPDSSLAKTLQEREDKLCRMLGTENKIKFVEKTGTKIVDLVGRKDPWAE